MVLRSDYLKKIYIIISVLIAYIIVVGIGFYALAGKQTVSNEVATKAKSRYSDVSSKKSESNASSKAKSTRLMIPEDSSITQSSDDSSISETKDSYQEGKEAQNKTVDSKSVKLEDTIDHTKTGVGTRFTNGRDFLTRVVGASGIEVPEPNLDLEDFYANVKGYDDHIEYAGYAIYYKYLGVQENDNIPDMYKGVYEITKVEKIE